MPSRFTNFRKGFTNRVKKLFTGEPIRRIAGVFRFNRDLPDYPVADNKDTYFKIWKDVAPIRGETRARVNATSANGFIIKTFKERDNESEDSRVKEVNNDFRNPRNKFRSTVRSFTQSLAVYQTGVLETRSKKIGGFIYPLDYRFCKFEFNASKTKVTKVLYNPSGVGNPIVYNEGEFVIATLDGFGYGADGISQLEALRAEANLYKASINYNMNQFLSGGVPQLAFVLKNGGMEEYVKMNEKIKDLTTDSNIGLMGDVDITKLSNASKDMEYNSVVDATYKAVMTVTQTPPIMMAQGGGSQGETNRQEMNAFGAEISGLQAIVEEAFAEAISNVYGNGYNDVYMKLLPWVDKRQEAVVDRSDMNTGIVTINELRKKRDLPAVKWGNTPYVANYLPEILGKRPWKEKIPAPKPTEPGDGSQNPNEQKPSDQQPQDPNQNEGNTGEEKPQGQDREENKNLAYLEYVNKWGLEFFDLVEKYRTKADCERQSGETVDECVSRKIGIILDENPDMKPDQAAAIAHSLCEC